MEISEETLKKILVETELVSLKDFNLAKKQASQEKKSIEQVIIEKGLVSDEELGQLLADELAFPFVNLKKLSINKEVLQIIPELVAKKQKMIVFDKSKEGLKIATSHPGNIEALEFLERKTGEKIIPYFTTESIINNSLKLYRKEITEEFEDIISKSLEEFKKIKKEEKPLPVIKMVDTILSYAYENRASDIHIEPYAQKTVLRYRIDGVLHDVLTLSKKIHDFLIARIKILSHLRTDVHDSAQDGHFLFNLAAERVDVRVSVVPIEEGEKIVMRVLAERARKFSLEDLGFHENDLKIISNNLGKNWGMILASGPTGCGKTTTLYSLLKILNTRKVNIMTIEDPIEYDIEGVNQIQVNPKTNLTFSQGLRSILRQDPNIIMVGEIRDVETARLAANAAMTGHLVLSTFHANDAPTALTRLEDMGIEPFIVASTVNIAIAQRLVRKICSKCIESYEMPFSKLSALLPINLSASFNKENKEAIRLFRGKGCKVCQNTGYLGRIGIFEVLELKEPIRKLVMEKANASEIRKKAIQLGMRTMMEDGLEKAENGLTTLDEILSSSK